MGERKKEEGVEFSGNGKNQKSLSNASFTPSYTQTTRRIEKDEDGVK